MSRKAKFVTSLKGNSKNGINASDTQFDKFLHYDSSVANFFPIDFPGNKRYIGWITYLSFQMTDDSTYQDPTAYVFVELQNKYSSTTITQKGKRVEGHLFPIRKPGSDNKCDTYIKGQYSGKEELKFSILDKNLNPVDTKRIVVTLHMMRDTGQIFVL